MLLYYITDRTQLGADESTRRRVLLEQIGLAAEGGVDFIQLREKDLPARDLEILAYEAVELIHKRNRENRRTRLLVNSRMDIAIAAGADGVHLRSGDVTASEARTVLMQAGITRPVIGVSCHTLGEVAAAEAHGADFAVYGPVFGKGAQAGVGLEALRAACNRAHAALPAMPVLALGGITAENAQECIRARAQGIAAIRLFQQPNVKEVIGTLRALE